MAEEKIDQELDLRGEVCPYTFVKAKLMLEEMAVGQTLRVLVNCEEAIHNVPRSMTNEGQQVLRVRKLDGAEWEIVVRKEKGD